MFNNKPNAKTVSFAPLSSSSRPRSSTISGSSFSSYSSTSVPRLAARLPKQFSFEGLTDERRQRLPREEEEGQHYHHHLQGAEPVTVQAMDRTGVRAEPSCSTSAAVPDGQEAAAAAGGSTAIPGAQATTTSQPAHLEHQQQQQQPPIEEQASSTPGLAGPDAATAAAPPPPHLRSYLNPPGAGGMFIGGHQPFMASGVPGQQPMYFHAPLPNGNMMTAPMSQMPHLGMGISGSGGGGAPYLLYNPPIVGPSIPVPPGAIMPSFPSSSPSQISPFFANGQGSLLNPPAYITGGGHHHAAQPQPQQHWANPYYQQQPFLAYPQTQQGQQQHMYFPAAQVHPPGTAATVTVICAAGQPGYW